MNVHEVKVERNLIYEDVYNVTANAAVQRGDALRVATDDNAEILDVFLDKGTVLVEMALGRYGKGLNYSMPDNWNFEDEINRKVHRFLVDFVVASWMGLTTEVQLPVLDLMPILNKREKPI